jgi:hypothetical protein
MSTIRELGVLTDVRIVEVEYPADWRPRHANGLIVPDWRAKYPNVFDRATSGMSGERSDFAQECVMFLLYDCHRWRSITWYKLAMDPTTTCGVHSSPEMLAARQKVIAETIGVEKFNRLRAALIEAKFGHIKGEPDLFCWHPDKMEWFFAEVKAVKDGLRGDQIRWMLTARAVLGPEADLRIYLLAPSQLPIVSESSAIADS